QWMIPRKKITSVSFDPLSIESRRRHYGDSCRPFYQEHQDFFEGMSRKELKSIDPTFSRSLYRKGEINEVGLERTQACPLSPEEESAIVASNPIYQGNAAKAARELKAAGVVDRSSETFRTCWKKHKLKINSRGAITPKSPSQLPQEAIDEINETFGPCNGVISKAARILNRKRTTVSKYWRQAGLIE
ncbi:hypothetical protein ACFLZB_02870, partial [Nanoarchaeota archaeon]